jgi:hypothetical protein
MWFVCVTNNSFPTNSGNFSIKVILKLYKIKRRRKKKAMGWLARSSEHPKHYFFFLYLFLFLFFSLFFFCEKKYTIIILPQLKKDASKEKKKTNIQTSFLLSFFIDLIDLVTTRCGVHHNKHSTEKSSFVNGLLRGTAPSPAPGGPSLQ